MTTTTTRRRIYGVDFSGAQDAGEHVWLASAVWLPDTLFVEACYAGKDLPGSGADREECLPALRSFLEAAHEAVVGLDFPFGVPAEIAEATGWREFLATFPNGADGPGDWAEHCRERAETLDRERVELKRATDEATGAPWSPYNLRMRAATYYGVAEVLGPLVEDDAVAVLPMQMPNPGLPWLLETCPAVTLDRLDVDATGYKDGDDAASTREAILETLTDEHDLQIAPSAREAAVETDGGDALDAIVAALGVAQSLERGDPVAPGTVAARARLEGLIYG